MRQGRTGDYRTAPETSPLFAVTFARFFRKLFAELGSPERWTICEVGAGNGDFAFDVLSTLQKRHPSVFDATRCVIDEVSPQARTRAFDRLVQFDDRIEFQSLVEVQEPFMETVSGFVEAMRDECGLRPASLSKYETALLSRGLQPDRPLELGPTLIDPTLSVGEVAFAVMRRHFEAFMAKEPGTRLG